MFWLQVAGGIALLAGIALIILGLFENPSEEPLGPAEPFEPHESDSGYGSYDEYEEEREHRKRTEFGGVVMIGPIPIVFGNNTRAATLAIVLTIFLMLLTFMLFFFPWVR